MLYQMRENGEPLDAAKFSGSSLSAQARYVAGTWEILECSFEGQSATSALIMDGAANRPERERIPISVREV
jgi:hypothetical protein